MVIVGSRRSFDGFEAALHAEFVPTQYSQSPRSGTSPRGVSTPTYPGAAGEERVSVLRFDVLKKKRRKVGIYGIYVQESGSVCVMLYGTGAGADVRAD